jgi:hypothetical protein
MANIDPNLLFSGQSRVFVQRTPNPSGAYFYQGCMSLDGPSQDLGEPDPVYCPSSIQRNKWDVVAIIPKTPALPTSDFTTKADRFLKDIWWSIKNQGCEFNLTVVSGACQRPDDFSKWDSKLLFRRARLTNLSLAALNALTGDDNAAVDLTGSFTFLDWEPIYPIVFGEVADATILAEIQDGFYYDIISCGECGVASDGCKKSYFLARANSGSPGLSGQLIYSLDDSTYSALDIAPLGGLSGDRMAAVGSRCVIVSQAIGGHVYAEFDDIDAGTANAWTKITTGYVSTKGPRAIYVKSTSEVFIAGAGGYIYLLPNPIAGVSVLTDGSVSIQDLSDIHGFGNTVVAVGNNNAVLKSSNAGDTFALVTGPLPGQNLSSIWLLSDQVWFVGTGNGKLYYTLNGGTSWTLVGLPSTITVINDIKFADDTVGYMSVEQAGAAKVYRTTDSGNTWYATAPSISSLPTANRINVVAPCGLNKVAAGGRKTVGGDGILAVGA